MTKALIKHVAEGEVLTPVHGMKIRITIDTATMQRANEAFEQLKLAMRGRAVPLRRPPDERDVIDQV